MYPNLKMWRRILVAAVFREFPRRTTVNFHTTAFRSVNRKQITERVHPFSHINVNLKGVSQLRILPYDLLDCPDANILRATVTSDAVESGVAIQVQDNDVNVTNEGSEATEILLEIPVKADLTVESDGALEVSDLHSDQLAVKTAKGIKTKNLRSENIQLHSGGNVECRGLTLGYRVQIKAENSGNISLEKIQGEELQVDSDSGTISTESCYSTFSKFTSKSGNMALNSVHRTTEVNILEQGNLQMCGFNGTLLVKVRRGNVRLQLAELWGENVVITNDSKEVSVNVADAVVDSTYFHAAATDVHLDETLKHLRGEKETGATTLGQKDLPNKIFIQTKGRLEIRRLSWVDAIKLKM